MTELSHDLPFERRSNWMRYASAGLPLILIIIVALAAYANAWPNALVHDDKFYVNHERFTELSNIPRYFKEDVWESTNGSQSKLYRPLLMVSVTLDARWYGDWFAGYHLSNIFLHALVSILVYGFLFHVLRLSGGSSKSAAQ
jgi:hypothetical protein